MQKATGNRFQMTLASRLWNSRQDPLHRIRLSFMGQLKCACWRGKPWPADTALGPAKIRAFLGGGYRAPSWCPRCRCDRRRAAMHWVLKRKAPCADRRFTRPIKKKKGGPPQRRPPCQRPSPTRSPTHGSLPCLTGPDSAPAKTTEVPTLCRVDTRVPASLRRQIQPSDPAVRTGGQLAG